MAEGPGSGIRCSDTQALWCLGELHLATVSQPETGRRATKEYKLTGSGTVPRVHHTPYTCCTRPTDTWAAVHCTCRTLSVHCRTLAVLPYTVNPYTAVYWPSCRTPSIRTDLPYTVHHRHQLQTCRTLWTTDGTPAVHRQSIHCRTLPRAAALRTPLYLRGRWTLPYTVGTSVGYWYIYTSWYCRLVSGWLDAAMFGSPKGITEHHATPRPLRHSLRACVVVVVRRSEVGPWSFVGRQSTRGTPSLAVLPVEHRPWLTVRGSSRGPRLLSVRGSLRVSTGCCPRCTKEVIP